MSAHKKREPHIKNRSHIPKNCIAIKLPRRCQRLHSGVLSTRFGAVEGNPRTISVIHSEKNGEKNLEIFDCHLGFLKYSYVYGFSLNQTTNCFCLVTSEMGKELVPTVLRVMDDSARLSFLQTSLVREDLEVSKIYPLVMTNIAMKNETFIVDLPIDSMVMFHSFPIKNHSVPLKNSDFT